MLRIYLKQNINILLKHAKNGVENLQDPKPFIAYLNNMQDVSKIIEEHNSRRKYNVLILIDDMIADMISNQKYSQILTELFIR